MRQLPTNLILTAALLTSHPASADDFPGLHANEVRQLQLAGGTILSARHLAKQHESLTELRQEMVALRANIEESLLILKRVSLSNERANIGTVASLSEPVPAVQALPQPIDPQIEAAENSIRQSLVRLSELRNAATSDPNNARSLHSRGVNLPTLDTVKNIENDVATSLQMSHIEKLHALSEIHKRTQFTGLISDSTTVDQPTFQTNLRHRQ